VIIDVTGRRATDDEDARFNIMITAALIEGGIESQVNLDWPTAWKRLRWLGVNLRDVGRVLGDALEHGSHQVSV
jgi:hypothetical protein